MVIIKQQNKNNDSVLIKTIIHELKNETGLAKEETQVSLKAFSKLVHYRTSLKNNAKNGSFLKKDHAGLLTNTKRQLKDFLVKELWFNSRMLEKRVLYKNLLKPTVAKNLRTFLSDELLDEVLKNGFLNDEHYSIIALAINKGIKEFCLIEKQPYNEVLNALGLKLLSVDSSEEYKELITIKNYSLDKLFASRYHSYDESLDLASTSIRLPETASVKTFANYFLFNKTESRIEFLKELYGEELKLSEVLAIVMIFDHKNYTDNCYFPGTQHRLFSLLINESNDEFFDDYSELTLNSLLTKGKLPKELPVDKAVFVIEQLLKNNYYYLWMRNDYDENLSKAYYNRDDQFIIRMELINSIQHHESISKEYDLPTELLVKLLKLFDYSSIVIDVFEEDNASMKGYLNSLAFYTVLPMTSGKQREELLSVLDTELVFSHSINEGVFTIHSTEAESIPSSHLSQNYKAWRLYEYFSKQKGVKRIVFNDPELSFVNKLIKKDAFYRMMLLSNAGSYRNNKNTALKNFYKQLVNDLSAFNEYRLLYSEEEREYVMESITILKENLDETEQALIDFLETSSHTGDNYYPYERKKQTAIELLNRY